MPDIVVIGGGAAGLMAGITAAEQGAAVVVLERMKEPDKIEIFHINVFGR